MPRIEVVSAKDAPPMPKKMSKVATELVTALNGLKKDEVLKLEPDEGRSLRGLKTSVGRITKSNGIAVSTWEAPDQTAIFVKKES